MRYISTRGGMPPKKFSQILLAGLAPDGGLAMPETYPRIDVGELAQLRSLGYADLAFEILSRFVDDIPADDLRNMIARTYSAAAFQSDEITPLKTLEPGLHILGLSHGPTLAFKDIAMQLLGNLFEYALEKTGERLNILGATSGDTGPSAEYAMRGKRSVRVFMLSPQGKMSTFQTAQMFSLQDPNIFNIAIRGVCYRPRETAETLHTSSPSMDISKASNFERFIFDLTARDAARVKELWSGVDAGGSFNLDGTPYWERISDFGLVSGTSNHSARIEMIRKVYERYGLLVDPHTADGLKVGLEHREAGLPLICLETALPVKFSESIVEAIGREPARPAGYENIEDLPRRYVVMNADADVVKAFITEQARQD